MIVLSHRREVELHRVQCKPCWPYVFFGKDLGLEDGKEHRKGNEPFPTGMRLNVFF